MTNEELRVAARRAMRLRIALSSIIFGAIVALATYIRIQSSVNMETLLAEIRENRARIVGLPCTKEP